MAAQAGQIIMRTPRGIHCESVYFDDTAGNRVNFDDGEGAGASTSEEFVPPVGVTIIDVVLAAATGQTKSKILVNGMPIGVTLLNALHLASVVNRPTVGVNIPAKGKLEIIQVA